MSGTVDVVRDISTSSVAEALAEVEQQAIKAAILAGADPATVTIIDKETLPIAYTPGKCRFYVKAAGEWSGKVEGSTASGHHRSRHSTTMKGKHNGRQGKTVAKPTISAEFIRSYRPAIKDRVWYLSEPDLEWIADGCYILGCV